MTLLKLNENENRDNLREKKRDLSIFGEFASVFGEKQSSQKMNSRVHFF